MSQHFQAQYLRRIFGGLLSPNQRLATDKMPTDTGHPFGSVYAATGGRPRNQSVVNRSLLGLSPTYQSQPDLDALLGRKDYGEDDPWLPSSGEAIPKDVQRYRAWLQENRRQHPLIDLGADPRRLVTGNKIVRVGSKDFEGWYGWAVGERRSARDRLMGKITAEAKDKKGRWGGRPKLGHTYDVYYSGRADPSVFSWKDHLRVINHESTHRAINMLTSKEGSEYLLDKDKKGKGRLPHMKIEVGEGKYKEISEEAWVRLNMSSVDNRVFFDQAYGENEKWFRKNYKVKIDDLLNDPGVLKGIGQLNKAADLFRQSMGFPRISKLRLAGVRDRVDKKLREISKRGWANERAGATGGLLNDPKIPSPRRPTAYGLSGGLLR